MALTNGIEKEFLNKFDGWIRIEPRCRSKDFARGIEARTADPLWMLTRQWQTGEFQGEDAGSPLEVNLKYITQSYDRIRLGESSKPFDLDDEPLEMIVEREQMELDWRARVQIGQQFERFARSRLADDAQVLIDAYRIEYALDLPSEDEWIKTDRATRRFLSFMTGRVIDGGKLLSAIEEKQLTPPKGISADQLDYVVSKFTQWCEKLNIQSDGSRPKAWRSQQLDYRFELNPSPNPHPLSLFSIGLNFQVDLNKGIFSNKLREEFNIHGISFLRDVTITQVVAGREWQISDGEQSFSVKKEGNELHVYQLAKTHLVAPSYRNGELDWYTFNIAGGLKGIWRSHDTIKTHPTRISVRGTSPRWWAFEDAATNFGRLDVAKPDLAKLILMEFVLIYGDDWFSVPLPVTTPTLVHIQDLKVYNVFGDELPINPARIPDPNPLLRWEIFTLSQLPDAKQPGVGDPNKPGVSDVLFVPAVAGFREESQALEEVRFLRDEGANMVWAVEYIVRNGLGRPIDGFDAQRERIERQDEADIARLKSEIAGIEQQLANNNLGEAKREELEAKVREKQAELTRLLQGSTLSSSDVPRYRLATTVPENWIPFIPINAQPYLDLDYKSIRLRRAKMLRNTEDEIPKSIPAMSRLLEITKDPKDDPILWLEEAIVPRSGLRVQLTAQRVRWVDGKTYVWLGRKVLTGRGEGLSNLQFDIVR